MAQRTMGLPDPHIQDDKKANTPDRIESGCIGCGLCVKECAFLAEYGNPGEIAAGYETDRAHGQALAFECSLCGLCTAVCPVDIDPAAMFLGLRQDAVKSGRGDFSGHARILNYERRGTSKKYTWYHLPQNCDTLFFPGCALAGTRPGRVMDVFKFLSERIPGLGIVLDCCTKPSHDLGRETDFNRMFSEMKNYFLAMGIRKIIVACPNCYKVFSEYGEKLETLTVYDVMAEYGFPAGEGGVSGTVTIHDPCVTRLNTGLHDSVRGLVCSQGLDIVEMEHSGEKTLCCGEGGSVGFISKGLAERWGDLRKNEAGGNRVITYCAGCTGFLSRVTPTSHILDLIFEPEKTLAGKVKPAAALFTYLNRIRLKKRLMKQAEGAVTRERDVIELSKPQKKVLPIALILAVTAAICGLHFAGFSDYLNPEVIKEGIESYGVLAPLVYILIYAIAPALFMPALPLTIAGGILFGPLYGVVYAITGATAGACIAFLIARYTAAAWVQSRLNHPGLARLNRNVEKHGWKVVAFTRLIPLFPFNLLNYAFGLTKIKFIPYAAATFICMLPACIAFIIFSSSLPDLLRGEISPLFIAGIALIVLVAAIPAVYNRFIKK